MFTMMTFISIAPFQFTQVLQTLFRGTEFFYEFREVAESSHKFQFKKAKEIELTERFN
jgi:hypothetical protein